MTTKTKMRKNAPTTTPFARLLADRGLDVAELAVKAKIGRATMWRYRAGTVQPRRAQMLRLASALLMPEVELADILGVKNYIA